MLRYCLTSYIVVTGLFHEDYLTG